MTRPAIRAGPAATLIVGQQARNTDGVVRMPGTTAASARSAPDHRTPTSPTSDEHRKIPYTIVGDSARATGAAAAPVGPDRFPVIALRVPA
jgi:hypothetical protein